MTTTGQDSADDRLAANLRALRERAGMSQAELARRMTGRGQQWHQSTVGRVEAGKQAVRVSEAEALAEILGVPLQRLLWAGPEANHAAVIDRAAAILRREYKETGLAAARLLAARDAAGRAAAEGRRSGYKRVRDACAELERELQTATLQAAVGDGEALYGRETGGDAAADPEGQP